MVSTFLMLVKKHKHHFADNPPGINPKKPLAPALARKIIVK